MCSATAKSFGMGPKGFPKKSISSPATITLIPLFAILLQMADKFLSKNWASSIATTSAFSAFHSQSSLLRTLNWGFYGTFTLSVCITLSSSSSSPEFRFPSTPASSSTTSVHIPPSLLRTFQQSSPGFAASCFCSYSTFHFMTLSSSIRYPEFRFPSSSASSATTSVHTPPSLLRTFEQSWLWM